jgi:hypothetical protein
MPRVRAARTARQAPQVVVVDADQEEAEEEKPTKGLPLFPEKEGVSGITLFRLEPIEEGNLGTLGPDADEETIRRRFGGGVYRITAKLANGEYAGNRMVTIAGDPRFESLDARRRYKNKMAGLDQGDAPTAAPPPAPPSVGLPEIIGLVTSAHEQQMQMMRLQLESQRQDAQSREDRLRREAEDNRVRDREFHTTILQVVKRDEKSASTGGMELVNVLLQGLQLGQRMADARKDDEGPSDPWATFVRNLPGILEHGQKFLPGAAPPPAPSSPPPTPPVVAARGEVFKLSGTLAERLRAQVAKFMAKGYTEPEALQLAEAALGRGVDLLDGVEVPDKTAAPPAGPPAPPAAPVPPPPPPVEPPKLVRTKGAGQPPAPRATPGR